MPSIPVLINGKAGSGRAKAAAREISLLLEREGLQAEVLLSESREQAAQWSRQVADREGLALVAGGDGTLNSVLPGFCEGRGTLGLIPLGTANCLARELGIPLAMAPAIRTALHGWQRHIDLGIVNDTPFAVMAGIGFDAQVVVEVSGALKNLIGPWAYVVSGIERLLQYQPVQMHVQVDGSPLDFPGWLVVLGNASTYAYRWRLGSDARIDDGRLDVCLFPSTGAANLVVGLSSTLVTGDMSHLEAVYRRGRTVTVESDPTVWVQVDGDVIGSTPVAAHIAPGALKVMVPHE